MGFVHFEEMLIRVIEKWLKRLKNLFEGGMGQHSEI